MSAETRIVPSALRFTTPPPGLEPGVDFTLTAIEGAMGLFSLTSADGTSRLFVLDASVHLPDYQPRVPGAELSAIGAATDSALVLVVVNPGARSTVNLAAPILVNPNTGTCVQVILDSNEWPLRAPLGAA